MTPLKPELRKALIEAHPGLTEEVIDEYEKLTAMRYQLTQQRSAETIADLDRRREKLLRERMPLFAQVSQMIDARTRAEARPQEPKVKIEIGRPSDNKRKR